MSTPKLAVIVLMGLAGVLGAQSQKTATRAYPPQLPPGPMKAIATTACMECHDSSILVQQRLSRAAWEKEVDKMTKWGALVETKDRTALIDYFAGNFGPDKPPYVAPRSATTPATR